MNTCAKDEFALSYIHMRVSVWGLLFSSIQRRKINIGLKLRNWAQNIISFDEIENSTSFLAIKHRYGFEYLGVILLPKQTMYLSATCVFEIAVKTIDLWSYS